MFVKGCNEAAYRNPVLPPSSYATFSIKIQVTPFILMKENRERDEPLPSVPSPLFPYPFFPFLFFLIATFPPPFPSSICIIFPTPFSSLLSVSFHLTSHILFLLFSSSLHLFLSFSRSLYSTVIIEKASCISNYLEHTYMSFSLIVCS